MSRKDAAKNTLIKGVDNGLTAIAEHYTKKVRQRIDKGYTTGNFSHHARGVAGRIMYTKPYDIPGGRGITVGTSKTIGFAYELGWELGHMNIFVARSQGPRVSSVGSRREGTYMRVEIWRPYLAEGADLYLRILARNIERVAGGTATVTRAA